MCPPLFWHAMKSSHSILLTAAAVCIALLGAALYLQMALDAPPCPHCILQRWLLATLALACIGASCLPARLHKPGAALALLIALAGIGAAVWHLRVQVRPEALCDAAALDQLLDAAPAPGFLPSLLHTDGSCLASAPLLGLSMPQWSLLAFSLIALGLVRYIAQPEPLVPWLH